MLIILKNFKKIHKNASKVLTSTFILLKYAPLKHYDMFNTKSTAYSPIAQSVEQRTVNPCVPGSSPGWRANQAKYSMYMH